MKKVRYLLLLITMSSFTTLLKAENYKETAAFGAAGFVSGAVSPGLGMMPGVIVLAAKSVLSFRDGSFQQTAEEKTQENTNANMYYYGHIAGSVTAGAFYSFLGASILLGGGAPALVIAASPILIPSAKLYASSLALVGFCYIFKDSEINDETVDSIVRGVSSLVDATVSSSQEVYEHS